MNEIPAPGAGPKKGPGEIEAEKQKAARQDVARPSSRTDAPADKSAAARAAISRDVPPPPSSLPRGAASATNRPTGAAPSEAAASRVPPPPLPEPAGNVRVTLDSAGREALARKLPVGSTVTARILESHGDGRYTVGIAGLRVSAESAMDLPIGARLNARVTALEPQVRLNLMKPGSDVLNEILGRLGYVNPSPEFREAAAALLDRGMPLNREAIRRAVDLMHRGLSARDAVRHLSNDLPPTSALTARTVAAEGSLAAALDRLDAALRDSGRGELADKLRGSVTFSGDLEDLFAKHPLKFERRALAGGGSELATDAKALLVGLTREDSPDGVQPGPGEAAQAARELLETLEGRYLAGDPVRHIPFVVEDEGARDGWIAAERSRERTNVRFKLGTSRLGEVVGVVDFVNRAAAPRESGNPVAGISIGVRDAETRKALLAKAPELVASLAARGVRLDSLTVDILKRGEPEAHRAIGLDLKI